MQYYFVVLGMVTFAAHFTPTDDAEANLKDALVLLHDLTGTLKTVKDPKTADGAVAKLKMVNSRLAALKKKDQGTQKLPPEEYLELRTKYGARFDTALQTLDSEVARTIRQLDFDSPLRTEFDRFKEANETMNVMNEAKASAAMVQLKRIDKALQSYKVKTGKFPEFLQRLTEGKDSLMGKMDLTDPWEKPYCYDPSGPRNQGKRPDIWTTTPAEEMIGNWRNEK